MFATSTQTGSTTLLAQANQNSGVSCTVEAAPTRDGVKLATEVYLPAGAGPFPVILQRTPYKPSRPKPRQ